MDRVGNGLSDCYRSRIPLYCIWWLRHQKLRHQKLRRSWLVSKISVSPPSALKWDSSWRQTSCRKWLHLWYDVESRMGLKYVFCMWIRTVYFNASFCTWHFGKAGWTWKAVEFVSVCVYQRYNMLHFFEVRSHQ